MVKAVFTFNVAPEKQSEYLKATAEKIKPYWESHGCQSYQIWQVESEATFIKEMLFPDLPTKDSVMGMSNAEANSVKALWHSFIDGDFELKTYIKKL